MSDLQDGTLEVLWIYSTFTLLEHHVNYPSRLKIPGPVKGRTGSIPVLANKKTGFLKNLRSTIQPQNGGCHLKCHLGR